MAEYIKRIDVMRICEGYSEHCFNSNDSKGQYIADRILYDVVEIPTADVVEVRYGEWRKPLGDNETGWNCGGEIKQILGCSCCGHFFQNAPYNYCPYCGAKMDGGAE